MAANTSVSDKNKKKDTTEQGVFEEDDDFEEFPVEGT